MPAKKCFVVMGFGEKPDYATGRTLNLDKTYKSIIKRAVEEAGLECVRADEVVHAGIIDKPMYELLLSADLVVADLSTANPNAIYELGVRHALKPRTTIVIAEKQFKFPFDIKSLLIRQYEHLGTGIDFDEAERCKDLLRDAIITLINKTDEIDSPVYTFLNGLGSPVIASTSAAQSTVDVIDLPATENSLDELMDVFKEARKDGEWKSCIRSLNKLLEKRPKDVYLIQQLALATYKSKSPSVEESLEKAKDILTVLGPYQTTDPETLGLWGAIYKRYWDVWQNRKDLDEAIWAYEKGFYLKNDYYNGINFAFLLNLRASISERRDAIADGVIAERIRKRVIVICEEILDKNPKDEKGNVDEEQKFWVQATLVEAYTGSGEIDKANILKEQIKLTAPEPWMFETMESQVNKLKDLLQMLPPVV